MAEGRGRIWIRQDVTSLPPSIGVSGVPTSLSTIGPIVSAQPTSLTTLLLIDPDGKTQTKTVVAGEAPTAIVSALPTRASSSNGPSRASITSTATSTAHKDDSSNLGVLIPAIVAPVAAILIISFVAFWLFMRRRQKKAIANEPEFVMEGMKEKPGTRPITADSNSSTRELVTSKNKETSVDVKEMDRVGFGNLAMQKETNFAPPRADSAMDSRPGSRATDQSGRPRAVPNFSRGPRSNTLSRDDAPSPAPGFAYERGDSRSGHRPPPSANGPRSNHNPPPSSYNDQQPRGGPRPVQPRTGSFSRPLGPPIGVSRPPPVLTSTRPGRPSQDENPPPTGAYNGASPISQYSPIIKSIPKFGTSPQATIPNSQQRAPGGSISSINDQGTRKPPPSAIKTGNSPLTPSDPKFSDENMRIARLANNNRLGLHSVIATTAATSPATEEPPTPSPRLPPPATRDAPPTNYNIPLPTHEPAAPPSIQARLNGASISDRRSVVSGLSDDYVDMEVDDNKSDVSSLDEREKWQMRSDTDHAHSRQAGLNGYGGLGPRPPLLSTQHDSHTSEASGSQYSLGYYTKNNSTRENPR